MLEWRTVNVNEHTRREVNSKRTETGEFKREINARDWVMFVGEKRLSCVALAARSPIGVHQVFVRITVCLETF